MQVKKFRAKTIKEAIEEVKRHMGPDAMILSTRKISFEGTTGFEVTVVPSDFEGSASTGGAISEVKSELMRIREMMVLLNHSGRMLDQLFFAPDILLFYGHLVRSGVDERHVRTIMEQTGIFNGHANDPPDKIKARAIRGIMGYLSTTDPFAHKKGEQIIAALVGTTGVGKTTTIAKIAAQLMLNEKRNVGLISVDTYRIGAIEQLKAYANILGIPCFQAFKKKDLKFAMRTMADKDVILVDTAGQSHYDLSRIDELKHMVSGDLAIGCHLLLSVSTTAAEMNRAAANFSALGIQSYLFTKMDEAKTCGSVVNQMMAHRRPISYFTNGQGVPEDIERADKRKFMRHLLGYGER